MSGPEGARPYTEVLVIEGEDRSAKAVQAATRNLKAFQSAVRKAETFRPVGADDPLPSVERVRVTAASLRADSDQWDAEMPGVAGLLAAEVIEDDG